MLKSHDTPSPFMIKEFQLQVEVEEDDYVSGHVHQDPAAPEADGAVGPTGFDAFVLVYLLNIKDVNTSHFLFHPVIHPSRIGTRMRKPPRALAHSPARAAAFHA